MLFHVKTRLAHCFICTWKKQRLRKQIWVYLINLSRTHRVGGAGWASSWGETRSGALFSRTHLCFGSGAAEESQLAHGAEEERTLGSFPDTQLSHSRLHHTHTRIISGFRQRTSSVRQSCFQLLRFLIWWGKEVQKVCASAQSSFRISLYRLNASLSCLQHFLYLRWNEFAPQRVSHSFPDSRVSERLQVFSPGASPLWLLLRTELSPAEPFTDIIYPSKV